MRRWAAPAADEKLAEAGKMPKCVCVEAYITEVYTQWVILDGLLEFFKKNFEVNP